MVINHLLTCDAPALLPNRRMMAMTTATAMMMVAMTTMTMMMMTATARDLSYHIVGSVGGLFKETSRIRRNCRFGYQIWIMIQ